MGRIDDCVCVVGLLCSAPRAACDQGHPKDNRFAQAPDSGQEPLGAILSVMFFRFLLLCLSCATTTLFAQSNPEWTEPFPPHNIVANVYYVGSKDLASYL